MISWIEALKQGAEAVEATRLLTAVLKDPATLGVLPLYLAASAWLAHRLTTRRRPCRRRLSRARAPEVGLLRFLSAVAFLALGLLLAVARTAGRSTFHSWARF